VNTESQNPENLPQAEREPVADARAAREEILVVGNGDLSAEQIWRSPTWKPRRLWLAVLLFVVTFVTCLAAGRQFAIAFSNGQAASLDEFATSFKLIYKDPTALATGFPFALALMTILLVHELGHYFACKHHGIRASYPYFIPAPTLIGTLGAFILMRSPIRTRRALFDVGASGPLAGFAVAIPILFYGVAHSHIAPGLTSKDADFIFGVPLALRLAAHYFFPGANPLTILLHPVARAAWVGLFATSLNLLPAGQLDGGHILRSLSPRLHKWIGWLVPAILLALWWINRNTLIWLMWAGILVALRFLRTPPVYDQRPLNSARVALAAVALVVMILCFIAVPFWQTPGSD
jgi:membrane-associated protease RseP (regulator of RpoE activity)